MTPRAAEALPQAPLCIHCGARVESLWRSYGAPAAISGAAASATSGSASLAAESPAQAAALADTPSGPVALPPQGAHVVLTPCAACEKGHAGADAYVEGEWGGVGLDLVSPTAAQAEDGLAIARPREECRCLQVRLALSAFPSNGAEHLGQRLRSHPSQLLVRPSAYRHLLFNRPWLAGAGVSYATLLRHGLGLGLVDACACRASLSLRLH